MNANAKFLQEMKEFDSKIINRIEEKHKESTEICEDTLYHKSNIPIVKGLPLRTKRPTTVKISCLLIDIEFNDDEDNS